MRTPPRGREISGNIRAIALSFVKFSLSDLSIFLLLLGVRKIAERYGSEEVIEVEVVLAAD